MRIKHLEHAYLIEPETDSEQVMLEEFLRFGSPVEVSKSACRPASRSPDPGENQELSALVEHWENLARVAFKTAEKEEDPFGKRAIEYGAMIHFNCAQELRRRLGTQT